MNTITEAVGRESYPGRGIIIGRSAEGTHAVCAYFIMGRSENSRNRVFVEEGAGIRTEARDPSKLTDPSLIIYAPVRAAKDMLIVTNGDQTDTIHDFLEEGKSFEEALATRTFEPDAPNYTPRISALIGLNGGFSFSMGILKSDGGNPDACVRNFFRYESVKPGEGRFIHTYGDDNLTSFEGEPKKVTLTGDIDEFAQSLFASLDEDNRVSLFVRFINLTTGEAQTRILNKY